MTALLSTCRLDLRLQWRNGFYAIALLAVMLTAPLMRAMIPAAWLGWSIPGIYLISAGQTFYLIAGLVLFEKGEGTLAALAVTPLSPRAWLLSKIATLNLMLAAEVFVTVWFAYGAGFNHALFLLGLMAMGALYSIVGLIVVVRFDSITDYLIPSIFIATGLQLNALDYFNLLPHPLFELWPTQPMLTLMAAAFGAETRFGLMYGLAGSAFWLGLFWFWAMREYQARVLEGRTV
ncbi:MAG: hypothetical protein GC154_11315 [bacterium]|nr:hypothetical protein [bacterium]